MQHSVNDANSCQLSRNVNRSSIRRAASPPDVHRFSCPRGCLNFRKITLLSFMNTLWRCL